MRRIAYAVLIFLMLIVTGCQTLGNIARSISTFPQELEQSSSPTIRAASRIGQKIALKHLRRKMKTTERDRFEADPSYKYEDFHQRLSEVHGLSPHVNGWDRDYQADITRDKVFDEPKREGEQPIPVMGNKEILVDDEGAVKVDVPKLYEKWLGKWPLKLRGGPSLDSKYKFDADARLSFDRRIFIDTYKAEVGFSRYSQMQRKLWRLSIETKYKSDHGDWTIYMQWEIPW